MSRNRSRLAILSEVLSFPTLGGNTWTSGNSSRAEFQVGDLVSMNAAPASKWYLSWLKEIDPNNGWPRYLLESIEDGSLCWWENIGLNHYDRKQITNPSWHWDDAQYAFNDRWHDVCRKNDAYIVMPCSPDFHDDNSVTLDVRIRFGLSDYHNPKTFPNWRRVTRKMLDLYYKASVEKYESEQPRNNRQITAGVVIAAAMQ